MDPTFGLDSYRILTPARTAMSCAYKSDSYRILTPTRTAMSFGRQPSQPPQAPQNFFVPQQQQGLGGMAGMAGMAVCASGVVWC